MGYGLGWGRYRAATAADPKAPLHPATESPALPPPHPNNPQQVCEITYGRVQGRDSLIQHFRASKFPGDDAEFQPLVYRCVGGDGGNATDPLTIHQYLGEGEEEVLEGGEEEEEVAVEAEEQGEAQQ